MIFKTLILCFFMLNSTFVSGECRHTDNALQHECLVNEQATKLRQAQAQAQGEAAAKIGSQNQVPEISTAAITYILGGLMAVLVALIIAFLLKRQSAKPLEGTPAVNTNSTANSMVGQARYCIHCGNATRPDAKFCSKCGANSLT